MELQLTYSNQRKVQSLSSRIKTLKAKNESLEYFDPKILREDLKINLTPILANIVINLTLRDRSKQVFQNLINEYNADHSTSLTIDDFQKISWIRIINNEIVLPRVVQRYIWNIGSYEALGTPLEIAENKKDIIECLILFHQRNSFDEKLTINKEILEGILAKKRDVTLSYLLEKEIIGFDNETGHYYWKIQNQFAEHLRNEIISTLWLLLCEDNPTESNFRRFLRLITECFQAWPTHLERYLSRESLKKLHELSLNVLKNEPDLDNSEIEFQKMRLDAPGYAHVQIHEYIPTLNLTAKSAYELVEEVEYHDHFDDIFDYQEGRSLYYLLQRFVIMFDSTAPTPYQNVLSLLKMTDKPFLVWSLYQKIKRSYPDLIPYLLYDSELAPLAFKLIDDLTINDKILIEQDRYKKIEEGLKLSDSLWIESFDILLEQMTYIDSSEVIAQVLLTVLTNLSKNIFSPNSHNENSVIKHHSYLKREEVAFNRLRELKKYRPENFHGSINPRFISSIIIKLIDSFLNTKVDERPLHNEFISIQPQFISLGIELLKLTNICWVKGEISESAIQEIKTANKSLAEYLYQHLTSYYVMEKVRVYTYGSNGTESRKVKRSVAKFGNEIIDWGYLYLHFTQYGFLNKLETTVRSSLQFDQKNNERQYADQNKEQVEKIRILLTSLMLAFIQIKENKREFEIDQLPIQDTINRLENVIIEYSLVYSQDNLEENRLDVFSERFRYFENNLYSQPLITLLFECVNDFSSKDKRTFIIKFFEGSIDIGRMLAARNLLESKDLRDAITELIAQVDMEKFISSKFDVRELISASIEAVNSDSHWDLSEQLLEKVESHYNRVKHKDEDQEIMFFEIRLLLAYKKKSIDELTRIPLPYFKGFRQDYNKQAVLRKNFFIALHVLFTEKDNDKAIRSFESLASLDPTSTSYSYYLYRAKTLAALKSNDKGQLDLAKAEWDTFLERKREANESTPNQQDAELEKYSEAVEANSIHYFISVNDGAGFDLSVSKLRGKNLYDEELIKPIYDFYMSRGIYILANEYILNAEKYYSNNSITTPSIINDIKEIHTDERIIGEIKKVMSALSSQKTVDIPRLLPVNLNGQSNLNLFVLNELIQGSRVLLDKIKAIKSVTHEDKYSDILLAALRLRFIVWGWKITDQPRIGSSVTGIDAGVSDIVIYGADANAITLVEAFRLSSVESDNIQNHISKCFGYSTYLNRYFSIVYYIGPPENFDYVWRGYQEVVLMMSYQLPFAIKYPEAFSEITDSFDNVNHLKIGKSLHENNIEFYHIFINLSE